MDKIVVEYSYGGISDGGHAVLCVEYESVEAFYVLFEEKMQEYKSLREKHIEEYQKWEPVWKKLSWEIKKFRNLTMSPKREAKLKELEEACLENEKVRPKKLPISFKIDEFQFDYDDFVEWVGDGTVNISMPTIMTLEEWFKARVNGEI